MAATTGLPVEDLKETTARSWTHAADRADCPRCGGLMVAEQCLDLLDGSSGHPDFATRRCVQCGEIIDPVILRNRQRQPASGLGTSRDEGGNHEVVASKN